MLSFTKANPIDKITYMAYHFVAKPFSLVLKILICYFKTFTRKNSSSVHCLKNRSFSTDDFKILKTFGEP
jgi:hypothetical protein